jgi:hypothetical protein
LAKAVGLSGSGDGTLGEVGGWGFGLEFATSWVSLADFAADEDCGAGLGGVGFAAGGGVGGGDSTGESKQVRMASRQASGPKA